MTTDSNASAINAVKAIADALYFLEQVAIDARDEWRIAKEKGDEALMKEKRKIKVKIHGLKKKAVMALAGQGFGVVKGYYKCVEAQDEPHLLAIDVAGREFLIPVKKEMSQHVKHLGDRGLVAKDTAFKTNLSIAQAFSLVNIYLNPNHEKEVSQFKKKVNKKPFKKPFKKASGHTSKKPQARPSKVAV